MSKTRTINEAHTELLRNDPGCCLTKTALRRLVTTGAIPSLRIGTKYLVDMDILEQFLLGTLAIKNAPSVVGATKRAEAGLDFAGQVPTYDFTTFPGKVKGAGGVRA